MSYVLHDRNLEQMLIPIALIRGGTSRAFFFERACVPPPGGGLEEFLLAVRGSPDPMAMDGLGGRSMGQSKAAIVSPSARPDADVDYTFVQMFPDQPTSISYRANCGNIAAAVPAFALMKNMIPNPPDGEFTVRAFSTNTEKMMYLTVEVLNGDARVDGDATIDGVPGTGSRVGVDFRDQWGGFTGKLLPTGNVVDSVRLDDGTSVDVTIIDMVNVCAFFEPVGFGLDCTGLELPSGDGDVLGPAGMADRIAELRLRVAQMLGWQRFTLDSIRHESVPFAVSVTRPAGYVDLDGDQIAAGEVDLVARFYLESVLHPAAPGSGAACLAAAASIPGTIPNKVLADGDLKAGRGGDLVFGHPSGTFKVTSRPVLAASPNETRFEKLEFPRTARILCDGRVFIKNAKPLSHSLWVEADRITADSFYRYADHVSVEK